MSGPPDNCRLAAAIDSRGRRSLDALCRYTLAAVFLAAGVSKVSDRIGFDDQVLLHTDLPHAIAIAIVFALPWLELTCGFFLALNRAVRETALVVALLLTLFLGYGVRYRHDADCHCFFLPQTLEVQQPWWPFARDGVLLLAALRLVVRRKESAKRDGDYSSTNS